jgi:hypothetical protein
MILIPKHSLLLCTLFGAPKTHMYMKYVCIFISKLIRTVNPITINHYVETTFEISSDVIKISHRDEKLSHSGAYDDGGGGRCGLTITLYVGR